MPGPPSHARHGSVTLDVPGDESEEEEGDDEESGASSGGDEEGPSSSEASGDEGGGGGGGDACPRGGAREGVADYEAKRRECVGAIRRDLGGLVRSKGFFWVATQVRAHAQVCARVCVCA
jgi:hypothetical protein